MLFPALLPVANISLVYLLASLYLLLLLLLQHLSSPSGLITVSSCIILTDAHAARLYSSLTSTNCLRAELHPRVSSPPTALLPLPLTPSPGRRPLGCQPQMVNYLLSEPRSPPLGARGGGGGGGSGSSSSSITAPYQRQPIELPPQPTRASNHLANNDSCSCQSG